MYAIEFLLTLFSPSSQSSPKGWAESISEIICNGLFLIAINKNVMGEIGEIVQAFVPFEVVCCYYLVNVS